MKAPEMAFTAKIKSNLRKESLRNDVYNQDKVHFARESLQNDCHNKNTRHSSEKNNNSSREQMTPTAQDCLVFCKKVKMIPLLLKMFSC